jgi:hypothetical protein
MTKVRRITAFFEELDVSVYRRARGEFSDELARMERLFTSHECRHDQDFGKNLFQELTRPREAMLRFDKVRIVLAEDIRQQFEDLYNFYIGRNFVTKEYQEKLIEKEVRTALRNADLMVHYKEQVLGDKTYHARFPFVRTKNDQPVVAIKPLHLGHDDPTQIFDHGWEWVGKIRKLKRENFLPKNVLFAVQGPKDASPECVKAFDEISDELAAQHVAVVDHGQMDRIVQFARRAA